MKKQTFKILLLLGAGICGIAILAGCPSSELGGVLTTNLSPWVEWSDTPQDSMQHSANPLLKWFGGDEDGQVIDYQYVVLLEEDIDTYGGLNQILSDFPDSIEWFSLGVITKAVIPLFASEDTSEFIDQFVFLRCLDDGDTYSEIRSLFLSRNNHPPTCTVTVPEGPRWCLPDTNEFWPGIGVSWEGKDSLDYEGIQPDFLWHVRMYGPFSTIPDSTDTLMQNFRSVLVNLETGSDTVTITSFSYTNLQTGWYILYVKNFDDAHVASVPALGIFEIYEPQWIRHPDETTDILVVNQSMFVSLPGNLPSIWADSVVVFYEDLLADAGFTDDQWDWTDNSNLTRSLLYNYRMVIVDDFDWNAKIGATIEEALSLYLNVGGKLWINGRFSFSDVSNQEGRVDYGLNDVDHPLPYPYLGISFAYFPPAVLTFSEFEGARPIFAGLPTLSVDTLIIQGLAGNFDYALPRVEYVSTVIGAQTLYAFDSIDPSAPGTFEGFPVAIRYETATFKSSYFSFPLFSIEYDQASEVANQMLDWFMSDSP
jgi:hypothetical protein